jgi:hypothetical protein
MLIFARRQTPMVTRNSASITYFSEEGRGNLKSVISVIQRRLKKQPYLRQLKLVIFTAYGEGPVRAYNALQEFETQIIAVTCPPDFTVMRDKQVYKPAIEPKLRKFFDGVGIKVLTGRLPFDRMEGMEGHNHDMQLVRNALSIFGGGIVPCLQAVMQACDMGAVEIGERVIAMSGDWAVLVTASNTQSAFTREKGIAVNEIFCKPSKFDICRIAPALPEPAKAEGEVIIEGELSTKKLGE